MKTLGVHRVALVVKPERFDQAKAFYSDLFGATFVDQAPASAFGLRAAIAFEEGIELVAPLPRKSTQPPSPIYAAFAEFLEKHGEGIFGGVFMVDDIEEACARAQEMGMGDLSLKYGMGENELKLLGLDRWLGDKFKEAIFNIDSYGNSIIFNEIGTA